MEAFSVLLALCAGNSLVTGEFPSQKVNNADFDVLWYGSAFFKQTVEWPVILDYMAFTWRHPNALSRYQWRNPVEYV